MKAIKRAAIMIFGLVCFAIAGQAAQPKPQLRIVSDALVETGNFYAVKGSIYNPSNKAVKNVAIKYYIWKKWMGQEGHGFVIKDTGGLVEATVKYIPPKQTVEFMATGQNTAPIMSVASGLKPDPINAEITAEWDQ